MLARRGLRTRWAACVSAAVIVAAGASSTTFIARGATPAAPWMRRDLPPGQRADLLLAAMTTPEKIAMLHGVGWQTAGTGAYAGTIPANLRLGIPEVRLQDGPAGVGNGLTGVTAFPAPIARAASWNVDTERAVASAIGAEQATKGVDVALAPTVNLARVPEWGRSYESFGEDPKLTSEMAVASVAGIQSQGVLAVVKHLAAYNQETDRMTGSADVSERALQELYLPAFRAAVQRGGAAGVMAAYNKVNGTWASESPYLLNALKRSWGFGGFVVSDWSGVHSTEASANAGLDMEMPNGGWFGKPLAGAVAAGRVSPARLDDMTRRVLTQLFRFGVFDRPRRGDATTPASTAEHRAVARAAATDGVVLLKNTRGLLPLASPKSIAVIGRAGTDPAAVGCGSAHVDGAAPVSPAVGLAARAGPSIAVRTEPGDDRAKAAAAARAADIAVVVVRDGGCEGADRPDLTLPAGQDALIEAVASANPRTIVVLQTQGPVLMPWVPDVSAVVETWYAGEQGGNALASVLFGDVDPGGRLPVTFPAAAWQVATVTPLQFPGVNGQAAYAEGLDIGYRHYDRAALTPQFAFGYGQSYTTFAYRDLRLARASGGHVAATFTVRNTGPRAGTDVAQLYLSHPVLDGEPPHALAGFRKVALAPGQQITVSIDIDPSSFAHWDSIARSWKTSAGAYGVFIGRSSAELALSGTINIGG